MADTRQTLLVVDDEANVLRSLKRLFFDSDYKVLTAESGAEGLDMFKKHLIHLVISDFRMPEMDGVEFLTKVKEGYPDIIRIVLSGYADVAAIVSAINEGHIYKFIAKPWNDQELLTTIMRAFEQYDLQRENVRLYTQLQSQNKDLEELTRSLEDKVAERTRDLQMKNRALRIAQNILNLLPVGVIGIDAEEMVVYMNEAAKSYVNTKGCSLGESAREIIDHEVLQTMMKAIEQQQTLHTTLPKEKGVKVVCTPLPGQVGVIGLFQSLTRKGRSEGVGAHEKATVGSVDRFDHTVLVVDDEEGILKALKRLLKDLPVSVITATSGDEGLELLQQHRVSVIIADQRMPGFSGVEFLRLARDIAPESVRILLTGYADVDAVLDAIDRGQIKYYFFKPWDDNALLRRIEEILADLDAKAANPSRKERAGSPGGARQSAKSGPQAAAGNERANEVTKSHGR